MDPILLKIYRYATTASLYSKRLTGEALTLNDLSDSTKLLFKGYFIQNATYFYDRLILLSSNTAIKKVTDKLFDAGLLTQRSLSQTDQSVSQRVQAVINDIFDRADKYNDFFEAIPLDFLDVPDSIQKKINDEIFLIENMQVGDFIKIRDDIESSSAAISNKLGRGSDTYNNLKDFGTNGSFERPITQATVEVLLAIQDVMEQYSSLINARRNLDNSVQSYVDFYTTLATDNGISIQGVNSKLAVPVPLGQTIEQIAARYLGDQGRWLEIAALNGLQAPYVDEEGSLKNISGTTSGNTIRLSNIDGLFVGKSVLLSGTGLPFLSAKIRAIQSLSQSSHLVDLDQDATGYSESAGATIKYYKSNTINSNMMVYIPSDGAPSSIFDTIRVAPEINDQTVLAAIAQADLKLTDDGDLSVTPSGDIELATGLTNIKQAGKLKLVTPLGSLLQRPEYGLGVAPGTNTADIDAQKIADSVSAAFLLDPRFESVLYSKVSKVGNTMRVDVLVDVPQVGLALPINTTLRQ